MLASCQANQWSVVDLDWSRRPREMSPADEIAIVQYFTDMSAIERLAGALFDEQQKRVTDETLKEIFLTFVKDEVRHAQVAQMLADFYNVHRFRSYRTSESLDDFSKHFLRALACVSDDIANAYITAGELMLDIALLRSINDFVDDDMSHAAMRLINRDESRHIAVDYHMAEVYSSPEYIAKLRKDQRPALAQRARGWWTIAHLVWYGKPFFKDVFFQPMEHVDPGGRRLREAVRRFQLLGAKPAVAGGPFGKFIQVMYGLQAVYLHPIAGPLLARPISRLAGLEPRFLVQLNTAEDLERARQSSYSTMAEEALAAKMS